MRHPTRDLAESTLGQNRVQNPYTNRARNAYTFCVRILYRGDQNASPLAFWRPVYGIRTQTVYGFRTRFFSALGSRISVFDIRETESVHNCGRNPYTICARNPYTILCTKNGYSTSPDPPRRRPNWIALNSLESPKTNDLEINLKESTFTTKYRLHSSLASASSICVHIHICINVCIWVYTHIQRDAYICMSLYIFI